MSLTSTRGSFNDGSQNTERGELLMLPDMKVFKFKSISPYFEKEREGLKPNTVREVDLNDERFTSLIVWNELGYNPGDLQIEISDAEQVMEPFIRDIEDISIWRNIMIISWKHEQGGR